LSGGSPPQPWGQVFAGAGSGRTSDGLSRSDNAFQGVTGEASVSLLGIIGAGVNGTISGGDDTTNLGFLDLNGDGLPDLLDTSGNGSFGSLLPTVGQRLQFLGVNNVTNLGHTGQ